MNDLHAAPSSCQLTQITDQQWYGGPWEEEMLSRWARPATVLNSYSLLTGLRQRAVNAGCMFAAFITLPYHCLRHPLHGTRCRKCKYLKHNAAVTRV